MSIIDERRSYQPFEYEEAHDFFVTQQQSHWLWTEFSMNSSVDDWEHKLNEEEKKIIAGVLLGFTQLELYIGGYWAQKVPVWFPKPEIQLMAVTFAAWETLHTKSYNYLNETLGLEEYDAFLQEPTAAAKMGNLINCPGETLMDKALSLATYSAFAEGVSLYSSFAILLYFSAQGLIKEIKSGGEEAAKSKYGFQGNHLEMPKENMLKGVGEIIAYSIRDEHTHSTAGCWLFRQLLIEFPELNTKELLNKVYDAARTAVELEFNFVDMVFNNHSLPGLDADSIKAFILRRTNQKLGELGLEPLFTPDIEKAKQIESWFYLMTAGESSTDFFAARVSNYAKGKFNVDNINWNVVLA
jgi:ribonucleoside-diphosphate reductase beta chain